VRAGDVIADVEQDQLGCPAHASIDGVVRSVGETSIEISTS
jgi:hypothetical protein